MTGRAAEKTTPTPNCHLQRRKLSDVTPASRYQLRTPGFRYSLTTLDSSVQTRYQLRTPGSRYSLRTPESSVQTRSSGTRYKLRSHGSRNSLIKSESSKQTRSSRTRPQLRKPGSRNSLTPESSVQTRSSGTRYKLRTPGSRYSITTPESSVQNRSSGTRYQPSSRYSPTTSESTEQTISLVISSKCKHTTPVTRSQLRTRRSEPSNIKSSSSLREGSITQLSLHRDKQIIQKKHKENVKIKDIIINRRVPDKNIDSSAGSKLLSIRPSKFISKKKPMVGQKENLLSSVGGIVHHSPDSTCQVLFLSEEINFSLFLVYPLIVI